MTKEKTQRDEKIRLEEGSLLETDVVQMLCQKKSQTSYDEREKSSSSTNTSSWIDDYFAASVCLSQMPHAQDSSSSSYYMCFCLHYVLPQKKRARGCNFVVVALFSKHRTWKATELNDRPVSNQASSAEINITRSL